MKLYLARHGRTNYNDLGLCNADPSVNVHLTDVGKEQAQALAEKLKSIQFDCIFVSELKRTKQTAEIVNVNHKVPMKVDKRLNDGRSGFEDKHFQEYYDALDASPNKWTVRFNDGESIQDIRIRVKAFLDDLKQADFDAILIVTSLWIMQAIIAIAQNLTYEQSWKIEIPQGDYKELALN